MASKEYVAYVDVDDTLVRSFGSKRIPITGGINFVRELKKAGATLFCWSSGGAKYAFETAAELGISECFDGFLAKPNLVVDDVSIQRWNVLELHPNEAASSAGEELLNRIRNKNF